jgi:hypothetical protein
VTFTHLLGEFTSSPTFLVTTGWSISGWQSLCL